MKTTHVIGVIALVLLIGSVAWAHSLREKNGTIIARNGLHAHPTLEIYVKGERIEIPQGIGIGAAYQGKPGYGGGGMAMTPMHTHDDVPIIHLEYQGAVRSEDITLGNFFEVWGKNMRSFGSNMRMTVNGEENVQYENYIMRDGDAIELHYE